MNRFRAQRPVALLITVSMALPLLAGCGGKKDDAPSAPVPYSPNAATNAPGTNTPAKTGMSTTKKVVILAGAAAAYYWYVHHKKAEQNADKQQYYISKSTGQIYYRDASHTAHFVTPPTSQVSVDESEAQNYKQLQGYNNQTTGSDLKSVADGE